MTLSRNSSLDLGYRAGDLSVYPAALDTRGQLYEVRNNAETTLKQSLTYAGKYLVVQDTDPFPARGLIRVGPPPGTPGPFELVYYDRKTTGVFRDLIRGFAGSRQNPWPAGSSVSNAVMAEHHNAVRDAILQIENNFGTAESPADGTLNAILKAQETRFLSPKPLFRAWPTKGPPALRVRFQNFSGGPLIRYLWDFGDGSTSVERSPTHTYHSEGIYSVKLNVITSLGAQGIVTKSNYIVVDDQERTPFFYVTPAEGYSRETAAATAVEPTEFSFVDQTDGDISQRYWVFDGPGTHDGEPVTNQSLAVFDPDVHTTTFVYDKPGTYQPSLLILMNSQKLKRAFLSNTISVL